ncbi:MAG: CPBP family intramembrane glutamic endopeptidase [Pseudomonadota bacterium]
MTTSQLEETDRGPWTRRVLRFSVVRIVLAVFVTAIVGGLTQAGVGSLSGQRFQSVWADLCGALAAIAAYALYVRWVERRAVTELSHRRALPELGEGLLAGAAMVLAVVGSLALLGVYRFHGLSTPGAEVAAGFAEMVFVGVFEELLSRAIVFRLVERSLGTAAALAISSLMFGLAHAPSDTAGALSVAIAVVAGVFFAAAFLFTRRLWLCMGLHVGWNFTLGYVFAIAVSGHPGKGFLVGELSGPAWLTGGAYGLEASVFTLLALLFVGGWLLRGAAKRGHWISGRVA